MKRWFVLALSLIALCALPATAAAQAKTMHANGTVKAVTDTSLTITASGGKEMTFAMDASTKFRGKGLGTKSQGGKLTPSTATGAGDHVSIDYHDTAGTMHASLVNVTQKGTTAAKK